MKNMTCTYARIVLLVFLSFISTVSCTDTSKQTKGIEQAPSTLQTAVRSEETLSFKTKEEKEIKLKDIYGSYIYEKTVCNDFVHVLAEDQEFVKSYEKLGYRERNLATMLPKRQIAKVAVVQYVLNHSDYFFVDVDFHGGPGMTYVRDSNIYCAQTRKRLEELEALGPSEQAWQARVQHLNYSLDALMEYGMPGAEDSGISYDFATLKSEFDFTKRLYSHPFKVPMKRWADKAAERLREKVDKTNEVSDVKKQHTKEIETWISQLNEGLE